MPNVPDKAKSELIKLHKNSISTSLVNNPLPKYFQHETKCKSKTTLPQLKSNQHLRELRHKEGCKVHRGEIACCADCGKHWSSEGIVQIYAKHKTSDCESLQIYLIKWKKLEMGIYSC